MESTSPTHFKGKEAIKHVAETQANGKIVSAEIHGTEAPGPIASACDAARETGVLLLLLGVLLTQVPSLSGKLLLSLMLGWVIWKIGRSAWLGWQRLERLHRVIAEEKWEIEHHREQEREELVALYSAKGFQGELLNEVVEVLMADGDRLLKVMIEEELNLTLESESHPLKQALGAGIGAMIAFLFVLTGHFLFGNLGLVFTSLIVLGVSGAVSAFYEKNRRIPAVLWNVGLGVIAAGSIYFLLETIR